MKEKKEFKRVKSQFFNKKNEKDSVGKDIALENLMFGRINHLLTNVNE